MQHQMWLVSIHTNIRTHIHMYIMRTRQTHHCWHTLSINGVAFLKLSSAPSHCHDSTSPWSTMQAHILDCILVASKVIDKVSHNVSVAVASGSQHTCPASLQHNSCHTANEYSSLEPSITQCLTYTPFESVQYTCICIMPNIAKLVIGFCLWVLQTKQICKHFLSQKFLFKHNVCNNMHDIIVRWWNSEHQWKRFVTQFMKL